MVGLAGAAEPPNMPAEGEVTVELLELTTLPKAGGAVVGGAAFAEKPPNEGAAVVAVVVGAPNEGTVEEVVDPKPNFGAAEVAPKAAGVTVAGVGATGVAAPKEKALVVVVAVDIAVVSFREVPVPKEKPPVEERVAAGLVVAGVDAVMVPKDGTAADAGVVVTVEEAVGDRGLKALNPEPLPNAGMDDLAVLKVF